MDFEELLLLSKSGNDDMVKLLVGKKVLDKLADKISKMPPSKKDKLLAMLLAEKIPVPELQKLVEDSKDILLKELLSDESKTSTLEMPKKVGEIGGRTVEVKVMEEKEQKSEEKEKPAKKQVIRLSDL
jgi:hypothetical protein